MSQEVGKWLGKWVITYLYMEYMGGLSSTDPNHPPKFFHYNFTRLQLWKGKILGDFLERMINKNLTGMSQEVSNLLGK